MVMIASGHSPNGPPEHHPPNPYADGHSTLPPSYRSVHPGVETLHRQSPSSPQAQPQCSSRNLGHTTRDDNIQEGGEAKPNVPDGAAHHTPSIIKIDDRRHSMVPSTEGIGGTVGSLQEAPTKRRSSVPGTSLIDTRTESAAPRNDSDLMSAKTYNTGLKDLVTIVTISGTIEPSASAPGKAVYTTSNGSNGGSVPSASTGNGATCTLLNSNSTPLVATVIPVSKSSTGGGAQ
ncbi:AGAP007005-PA-like protein [Anopheles sinensis]|uniref:AGAP007005-PA-like protein n=1 Tax=Anopheles sinensis TaxID=74873 RepID=A0A084WRS0_ANOSI|nr:AGAP007005-PA-like protein [Anopheles sinensis]